MVAEIVEAEENSTNHMRAIRVPPVITIKKSAAYALYELTYIQNLLDAGSHAFSIGMTEVINSNLLIELTADDMEYVYQRSPGKILDIIVPTFEACKVGVQLTCLIFGQEI
ncbi:hapless 2 [Perilla frutescens var. frutescens]|nr:hapless 2 [Perilla frutescens var. frutescens]